MRVTGSILLFAAFVGVRSAHAQGDRDYILQRCAQIDTAVADTTPAAQLVWQLPVRRCRTIATVFEVNRRDPAAARAIMRDTLRAFFVELSRFYPPDRFGRDPGGYFDAQTLARRQWLRAVLPPEDSSNRYFEGTVELEAQTLIEQTVRALLWRDVRFELNTWRPRWWLSFVLM